MLLALSKNRILIILLDKFHIIPNCLHYFIENVEIDNKNPIFAPSIGVPCLRNQTQKQAENTPIDGVVSNKFLL